MILTKAKLAILRKVAERPQDIFDLSDALSRDPQRLFDDCMALKGRRLIEWMYPEDEIAISPAGRKLLPLPFREASNGTR